MDLTVFVPDRGRAAQINAFLENFSSLTSSSTEVVVVLDQDDPDLEMYTNNISYIGHKYLLAPVTPRGMVGALNWAFNNYEIGYAVGFMGSDHFPRTQDWDLAYLDSLHSLGTGFVYGNDLYQGQSMPTQVAMTTDIPKTLGWMCPPQFLHLCVDVVWKEQGDYLNRITYLPEVIVEHMHPLAGKGKNDKNYAVVNNAVIAKHDAAELAAYRNGPLQEDMENLRSTLGIQ